MCMVSMIHDQLKPWVPDVTPGWPTFIPTTSPPLVEPADAQKTRELLEALVKAVEAAKVVDRVTGQPDCVDPEKAKLGERVRAVEEALSKDGEFTVTKGVTLEPGRYQVIGGKLFKVVE